jgi:hypothetical protein
MNKEMIKNKVLKHRIYWMSLLLITGLLSCEREEVCIPQFANEYRAGFFEINAAGRAEPAAFNFARIREVKRDSLFYTATSVGVNKLNLAFNPASDTAVYVFEHFRDSEEYGSGNDTLAIRYKRNFDLISPDCGLQVSYSDIAIVKHSFDSVQLLTTTQTEPAENFDVAIYSEKRCPVVENNRFQLGFSRMNETGEAEPEIVNFDEIMRRVGRVDSIFYSRTAEGISNLELTLNPDANSTTFVFKNGDARDTLSLSYTREAELFSTYCPPKTNYTALKVTNSTFGHVHVRTTTLTEGREGLDMEVFLESPCEDSDANPYRVGFFRYNEQGEAVPETVNFDEVRALGDKQVFYSRTEEGIERLELALNPEADSTTFVFKNSSETDTVTVAYSRENFPTGPAPYCQPGVRYTNITIKEDHTFEDVKSLREELNVNREGHDLEIFK